jgi:hypothetical protein
MLKALQVGQIMEPPNTDKSSGSGRVTGFSSPLDNPGSVGVEENSAAIHFRPSRQQEECSSVTLGGFVLDL